MNLHSSSPRRTRRALIFFWCFFGPMRPRRQTSKMTVWEISFNPREFLRFFSPFAFCPSLSCILSYLFCVIFFGVTTKNFYWRSSPLQREQSNVHSLLRLALAFGRVVHCRSHNMRHEMKNSFFNFSTSLCAGLHLTLAGRRSCRSENIRRKRWIIQNEELYLSLFTYIPNSIEISEIAAIIT